MEKVRPELMPSVVSIIRREIRYHSAMVQNRPNGKLDKLSERQNRPLRKGSKSIVVIIDGSEHPKFVLHNLLLGPKHTVRDNSNQVHFLKDVEKFVHKLHEKKQRVRSFVKLRQHGWQKMDAKLRWIEGSKIA